MRAVPAACAAMVLLATIATNARAEYPVLFVHGWCGDSSSWNTFLTQLPRRRFGDELVRYYQATDGTVVARNSIRAAEHQSFAIDFYDRRARTFDTRTVADIPIIDKVEQLKAVIDQIKRDTRNDSVIIVAHSMGGLVSRAYVQGLGLSSSGRLIAYDGDVVELVTIDTPHAGSTLADWPVDFRDQSGCRQAATINKSEMSPTSPLLASINGRSWPLASGLDAIVSYYSAGLARDSDGVVSRASQDVRTVSSYWNSHPSVDAHVQSFTQAFAPFFTETLHSTVLTTQAAITGARVQTIVDSVDRAPSVAAPTVNLTGAWSGRWSSTDGQGPIVLRLAQIGTSIAGPIELSGSSATLDGTFRGTVTSTNGLTATLSWTIAYRQPGTNCEGSFGGTATATPTTLLANYTGSDCRHSFSNGALSLTPLASVPALGAASRRWVASHSSLYSSELSATGSDTFVGDFRLANGTRVTVTDLAVTPDNRAYVVSFSNLYSVDLANARLTAIGSTTLRSMNALASDANGTLWGASTDGSVYQINRNDGSTSLILELGSGWVSSGDLAFDASGQLWVTTRRSGDSTDTLVTVNPTTRAVSARLTGLPAFLFGLCFVDTSLLAASASTNALYRIDLATGTIALVRRFTFNPVGINKK